MRFWLPYMRNRETLTRLTSLTSQCRFFPAFSTGGVISPLLPIAQVFELFATRVRRLVIPANPLPDPAADVNARPQFLNGSPHRFQLRGDGRRAQPLAQRPVDDRPHDRSGDPDATMVGRDAV